MKKKINYTADSNSFS